MSESKRIAAINDISCFGKCSLTVALPVLSAMGFEVCPLPTALLSSHTGINGYTFLDLSEEMKKIISHWKSMKVSFKAAYSGFLGSAEQIDTVYDFFKTAKAVILVDPVMGDNGRLYSTYTEDMCKKLLKLVCIADIITPNLTEASFLLGSSYPENGCMTEEKAIKTAKELCNLGPSKTVITSVCIDSFICNVSYDSKSKECNIQKRKKLNYNVSGTGDLFSSVLLGCILNGEALSEATEKAGNFVYTCIENTLKNKSESSALEFEKSIGLLTGN